MAQNIRLVLVVFILTTVIYVQIMFSVLIWLRNICRICFGGSFGKSGLEKIQLGLVNSSIEILSAAENGADFVVHKFIY